MSINDNSILGQRDLAVNEGSGECSSEVLGADAPLPRGKRRRRRAKEDRGLPPDGELAALARAYLQTQRRLWPKVMEAGLLLEPTEKFIDQMVADFKFRHR